jgi:transposase InsO family protein
MKAATFLEKLYDVGITPSNSRTRVSNDNAYSESLFKTLKFWPRFPTNGFKTIREARDWVLQFVRWYNTEHRHSALNYVTPQQRHTGEADQILAQRKLVIEAAKAANPQRWSGIIRNLSLPDSVTLNPEKGANC